MSVHSLDSVQSPDATRSPPSRAMPALMSSCVVVVVAMVAAINLALPKLSGSDLHPNSTALLWIVDAYIVVFGCLLIPAGALGDRIGRKGVLLAGLGVSAVGCVSSAAAPNVTILLAGRVVTGFGAALVMPATLSLLMQVTPPERKPQAIATWTGATGAAGAAGALGTLGGGLVLQWLPWQGLFLVIGPLALLLAVAVMRVAPRGERHPAGLESSRLTPASFVAAWILRDPRVKLLQSSGSAHPGLNALTTASAPLSAAASRAVSYTSARTGADVPGSAVQSRSPRFLHDHCYGSCLPAGSGLALITFSTAQWQRRPGHGGLQGGERRVSSGGSPVDGARVLGVLARPSGRAGGGQDSHGQQNPQGSGGGVGDRVRAVEAGHGCLRGRRGADQQRGPACPASAGLASARGPHAQPGRGQPGRDQLRGRHRVPGRR